MFFEKGRRLVQVDGSSTRWEVRADRSDSNLTFLKLLDREPSIVAPMVREVNGICINYDFKKYQVDKWFIRNFRDQFRTFCEAASGNFPGLPEPLDFFDLKNDERNIPQAERMWEPFFVYTYGDFSEISPINPDWVKEKRNNNLLALLKPFIYDLANILKPLHRTKPGLVIRQMPLTSLRRLKTNGKYVIGEFMSLARQGDSNYNSNIPFLALESVYAAPECFIAGGQLTPATDVYALGKTAMMFLGVDFTSGDPFPADITPQLDAVQKKYSFRFPDHIVRYFKVSLQRAPQARFQNLNEALVMFSGKDYQRPPNRGSQSLGPLKIQKPQSAQKRF
ncbi:MAG: hypothetical protein ACOYOS_04210 [Syntrophales bacterium]